MAPAVGGDIRRPWASVSSSSSVSVSVLLPEPSLTSSMKLRSRASSHERSAVTAVSPLSSVPLAYLGAGRGGGRRDGNSGGVGRWDSRSSRRSKLGHRSGRSRGSS